MSVPGKVYGIILTERLKEVTEGKVSKEQGGFRKGRGCVDKIFAVKSTWEKIKCPMQVLWFLRRHMTGLTETPWSVLNIHGVGGQLLKGK